ncbi:Pentatricopeptide repeat-containing protein [Actinidia chinensis var. chinensis]|uniref:Pentatricopeptide repeat-containing protein n=1 Tax=Actinidia chinensis var. chinensis TaxID=1590841 RepID=A0A2R6P964_ACTCC|nr:Pentatricopeptide repeat-containing protein [Actinidia chinensis var. chinensis]
MQALSIWPLKNEFWVVPKFKMEITHMGPSCMATTSRFRSSLLVVSSSSRVTKSRSCFISSQIAVQCRLFSGYSEFQVYFLCGPNKDPFRASKALTWTLEAQAITSEFVEQNSGPLDGTSGKNNANCDHVDRDTKLVLAKNENGLVNESEDEKGINNGEVGKKRTGRVDVRSLAWSLRFARTAKDVEEVLKDKGELPLQVYSTMIRGFGKDKRISCAMALVQWLKEKKKDANGTSIGPNLFIFNSLLGAVKQSQQFEEVEKVLNDMAAAGVVPNVVTYNTLMGIYIEQGRGVEALNLFEEIRRKGLSPSSASYSTTLVAYRRLEDGFGALKFYLELKEKYRNGEIGRDGGEDWENEFAKLENFMVQTCCHVMRRWLVKSDNLNTNVLKLLTEMDRAGLQTGRVEYERLMWACTREEHYIVAKELYSRIRERGSEISLSVCNHVIWLMGKAKKWWAALEIYEDLLEKGPKPNNMSYELVVSHFNILLTAARKRGIWRWGIRLLDKMQEKGLKPGSREWNAVLVACSKASETSAAMQVFKRMVEQGEKPTIISYGALLSALEKGKLYDEARRVWDHMIKVGVEPNLYAYTILVSIYTAQRKFNIVDSIIREMGVYGIEPTVVTYNAIISGCAYNNMGGEAYEWFHKMRVQNISPNEITYEMLIEALTKDGKPKLAYDFYLRAQNEGLNLASKAYDAVIQSSQIYGATIDVSIMGPRPPEREKKVQIRKEQSEFSNLADVPRRSEPFLRKETYTTQREGNL